MTDKDLQRIAWDAVHKYGAIQETTELAALLMILRDHGVKNFLEIGSEAGGTFYAFCQLATGKKISLDLPSGESGSGRWVEHLKERQDLMSSFAPDVHLIEGDSHNLGSVWALKTKFLGEVELLDFLFIDGDHTFYGVKTDYEMYSPFVKPGGIIAFHDIKDSQFHRHRDCMVADFWKTLKGKFKAEIRTGQPDWGGIGVVFV